MVQVCPAGRWMEVSKASETHDIGDLKKLKKIGAPHLHFERGSKVEAPAPYCRYEFVYFMDNASFGWEAKNSYLVTLAEWCKLCHHLSDRSNWAPLSNSIAGLFATYTGLDATTANIELAFKEGVVISSNNLPQKRSSPTKSPRQTTPKKSNMEKAAKAHKAIQCLGIQSKVLDTYAEKDSNYLIKSGWEMCKGRWRSKNCLLNKEIDENNQCPLCRNAKKVIQRSRHPMLFDLDYRYDQQLLPEHDKIRECLAEHTEYMKKEDIPNDPLLSKIAKILDMKEVNQIEFGKKQVMLVCECCKDHRICNRRKDLNSKCRKCQIKESKGKKKEELRRERYKDRVSPISKTSFANLSPEERKVRHKKLNNKRISESKSMKRIKQKFALSKKKVAFSEGMASQYKEALNEALTSNNQAFRSTLQDVLFDTIKAEAVSASGKNGEQASNIKLEQCQEFIDHVEESMRNMIHELKGNKNQCRYSPHTMALAMSLYLKAGPSAYQQFKEDSVIVVPDAKTLRELKQKQDIKEGCCIALYEGQMLMRPTKYELGQVMCDEMKLQKDVLINVKTGKIVGFTKDFIDMKKLIKNLLDEKEIDSFCKPATYINQWRYRAVNGRSYNCEFWFNYGKLSGNTLLRQFSQVVTRCEMAGSLVLGMVCDAGGNNARVMKLLRGKRPLEEGGWLSLDMVRTRNPWDPSRWIYMFHCSTHDLKAMRNQLFTSWSKKGKKKFRDVDGTPIAKEIVYNMYLRDKERASRGCKPMSEVKQATVILTRWTKMNVWLAKQVFSWKTLCEEMDHLYSKLGVELHDRLSENVVGRLGFVSAVARHIKDILKTKSKEVRDDLAAEVSSFEWLANVHEIFTARLMNMDEMIHYANIDRYEAQIKKNLAYFACLRAKQLGRRVANDKDWEQSFLAHETWRNLRITCRGFFGYCRYVIKLADIMKPSIPRFVALSPAHSNTSVLEAWFSLTRREHMEDPILYQSFVANRQMVKVLQALMNNKMYCAVDVGPLSIGKLIGPREMINYLARRKQFKNNVIAEYAEKKTHYDSPVKAFFVDTVSSIPASMSESEKTVLSQVANKILPTSYVTLILKEPSFQQWMQLSIGTPHECWFECFLEDTMERGCSRVFDNACRTIQKKLFQITIESFQRRNSDDFSFEYDLLDFYRSEEFALMYWNSMPGLIADNHACCVMVCSTLAEIHLRWVTLALKEERRRRNPELFYKQPNHSLTLAEQNSEVNDIIGWSVFSARQLLRKDMEAETDPNKMCELIEYKKVLESMITRERHLDEEYLSKYYDTNMAIYNHGGLTLIKKEYFEWAKKMMETIRFTFTEDTINQDPHNCFGLSEKAVLANKPLRSSFIALSSKYSGVANVPFINHVYNIFIAKATHARFGVVFRQWKDKYVIKHGEVALRTKLKSYSKKKKSKKKESKERQDSIEDEHCAKKMKATPSHEPSKSVK